MRPVKIMIWNAARGGMRSVVEAYIRDGFTDRENIKLIHSYSDGSFLLRQLILLRALAIFIGHLFVYQVDLVHCHAAMRGSFWRKGLFASLARLFGVPVLLHLHGSEMKPFYRSQPAFAQRLIRRHLELATRVLVLSKSWEDFILTIAPRARVAVVPNYVKITAIDKDIRPQNNILFLGVIGPRKGAFDLIGAFQKLRHVCPNARLTLAGNGQIAKAKALISELKLDDCVDVPGWIGEEARARLLASSTIYVLPSHNEGLPMSVLEAMASGLAVITTRVGSLPELVSDGVQGLLVEPGDVVGLYEALARLGADPDFRFRIALAGRERVESQYSNEAVLPLLHRVYEQCRSQRGHGEPH